ncbi:hypothetical protein VitviT2T_009274 [Vitis vinifera]|uniref:PGG domain-containing protein n=1 Tax=Vitis vinifera TaxID=29760 RepID=A0ABY9C552_VITVI|nr:hypothetical protein VitviT2T_009274 [Vitis vinifera]
MDVLFLGSIKLCSSRIQSKVSLSVYGGLPQLGQLVCSTYTIIILGTFSNRTVVVVLRRGRMAFVVDTEQGATGPSLISYAMQGKWEKVVDICKEDPWAHDEKTATSGDTALHIAVSDGREDVVVKLVQLMAHRNVYLINIKNDRGNTPLHLAASVGNVRMCKCIAAEYPELVGVRNNENETPLFLAALHGMKDAFLCLSNICSSTANNKVHEYLRRSDGENSLHCAITGEYFGKQSSHNARRQERPHPNYYGICYENFIKLVAKAWTLPAVIVGKRYKKVFDQETSLLAYYGEASLDDSESEEEPRPKASAHHSSEIKQKEEALKRTWGMGKRKSPVLIAAENGIIEMVEKILKLFPAAIRHVDSDQKNIVLLAVKNRQTSVYELLLNRKPLEESAFRMVDSEGNSALHLAATLGDYRPYPFAALQMQWEIKWYKYVKNSVPRHFFIRYNNKNQVPKEIFTESHKELVREGGKWLSNTSNSCSVVATLVTTVAFATTATIPGGFKENSSEPTLEHHPGFLVYAISSLIALSFSVTSVVTFLAILTSRYQVKDFGRGLPRKLLLGLTSLFISIGAMLVCFCAGHFFLLKNVLKQTAFPVYAVACLPVTFFAVAQFPFYFDLIWAIFKKVPQRTIYG